LGVFLRVVSWPLGMVLLAKGRGRQFVIVEISFALVSLGLLFGCMQAWHLNGVGVAFAALYVFYTAGIWIICRRLSGFGWTSRSRKLVAVACGLVAVTFAGTLLLPEPWATIAGGGLAVVAAAACFVGLRRLLNIDPWAMIKKKFGGKTSA
jgi:PST family polysaccharide transporter